MEEEAQEDKCEKTCVNGRCRKMFGILGRRKCICKRGFSGKLCELGRLSLVNSVK